MRYSKSVTLKRYQGRRSSKLRGIWKQMVKAGFTAAERKALILNAAGNIAPCSFTIGGTTYSFESQEQLDRFWERVRAL